MGGVLSFIFGVYLVFTFVIKYLLSRFLKPIFVPFYPVGPIVLTVFHLLLL